MTTSAPLVLASTSPRRRELLSQASREFRLRAPSFEERTPAGVGPEDLARAFALGKARSVSNLEPASLVLGADTVVALNGDPFGKPESDDHARQMLHALSGRCHDVFTGVALCHRASGYELARLALTLVRFRQLSAEEIEAYVATGEGRDKAGAYAIQGEGGAFVETTEGSYSNVVGLPLELLNASLAEADAWIAARG